jgi:hypothetical protein
MKVSNLLSSNGNKVPNQFIIETDNKIFFQSYNSMIAEVYNGKIFIDPVYYKYSKTTSKYLNRFLNMNSKEIQNGLQSGLITFKNLN